MGQLDCMSTCDVMCEISLNELNSATLAPSIMAIILPRYHRQFRGRACWCYPGKAAGWKNYHNLDHRRVWHMTNVAVPENRGLQSVVT